MKYWKAGIFFLIGFLIQPSFLNLISIKGYSPNLLLALVIVFGMLYNDESYSIVLGGVFGLLYDVCFGIVVGPTAFSLMAVGVIIIIFREFLHIENIVNIWIVSAASILLYYCIDWCLQVLAGNKLGFLYMVKIVPWVGLYTIIVVTLLYLVMIRKMKKQRKQRYFR